MTIAAPDLGDDTTAVIGDDHLLEEAPEHLATTINGLVVLKTTLALELGQQMGSPFNRTCYKLREETDIGKEGHNIMGSTEFMLIDIDGITKGLESIKADAHRQNDIQRNPIQLKTHGREQERKTLDKEIVILENP